MDTTPNPKDNKKMHKKTFYITLMAQIETYYCKR